MRLLLTRVRVCGRRTRITLAAEPPPAGVAPSTPRAGTAASDVSEALTQPATPSPPPPAAARPSAESIFAGGSPALVALRELISWPVLHADLAASLGVRWPRGLLLHGPPGCGKTLLVRAMAAECGAEVRVLTAGEVFGSFAGESERRLRDAFASARTVAAGGTPCVLFLDELDALCPRRSGGHEHEARVTAQLLVLMVRALSRRSLCPCVHSSVTMPAYSLTPLASPSPNQDGAVPDASAARLLVVGATNRPDVIDDALRRPGRFDREVEVPVPDAAARGAILELHAARLPRAQGLCLREVGAACFGYTGADLAGTFVCLSRIAHPAQARIHHAPARVLSHRCCVHPACFACAQRWRARRPCWRWRRLTPLQARRATLTRPASCARSRPPTLRRRARGWAPPSCVAWQLSRRPSAGTTSAGWRT
jgi:hypothetical protein